MAGYLAAQAVKALTVAIATAEISEQTVATTVTLDSTISHEDGTDSERLDEAKVRPRSGQVRSLAQLCPTLCDPMDCSTPGLPEERFPSGHGSLQVGKRKQ